MTLDQELLRKAKAAGDRLSEAERKTQEARGDYHTYVRRLHLAGASLREVAQALDVSHQRVQQIVQDAGGSWWQRVWRSRNMTRDLVCSFCSRPPSEVSKLLAGPNVFICDGCIALAERGTTGRGGARNPFALAKPRSKTPCSFCSKRSGDERAVLTSPTGSICSECLGVCRQILDDRTPESTKAPR